MLTRLPTWVVAWPATPVISDRTLVKPRLSFAVATAASAASLDHGGLGLRLLLDFVVQLALRDCASLGQRRVAVDVDLRQ